MIELRGIGKLFERKGVERVQALQGISLTIERGEFVAIVGSSGSGKSTLMNIIGLLDVPNEGTYRIDGKDVLGLSTTEHAHWRNQRFGFVFQAFRLLPRATAVENVELPLLYSDRSDIRGLAETALRTVGLAERARHRPSEMSGGQQQRVAVARALVNQPDVILADEPTGNLDARSALEIMSVFQQLHSSGKTIVMVTHDAQMAEHCQRIARIERGRIVADQRIAEPKRASDGLANLKTATAA